MTRAYDPSRMTRAVRPEPLDPSSPQYTGVSSGPTAEKFLLPDQASRRTEPSSLDACWTSLSMVTGAMRQILYPLYVLYCTTRFAVCSRCRGPPRLLHLTIPPPLALRFHPSSRELAAGGSWPARKFAPVSFELTAGCVDCLAQLVLACPVGNAKMQEIAAAIQEGSRAFLVGSSPRGRRALPFASRSAAEEFGSPPL
eukprot:1187386-Prorocentrum_minimum.AAC.1